MTRIDRRALFATGSAAALLAAVGVSAQSNPTRGGELRAALSGADRSEDWLNVPGGRFLQAARNAVFETLTEIAADGTLQPGLASSWQSREGGAIWNFDLRDDVAFHDGTPLSARDVVVSMQAHGLQASDVGSVQITLPAPDPAFPFRVVRDGLMVFKADQLLTGAALTQGTGLYRMTRFDAGRSFIGERVKTHRKDGIAGWFDRVELVAASDEVVRANALRDGIVDVADVSAPHDLSTREDIRLLTNNAAVGAALRNTVQHALRIGLEPLDDMRFVERWWMDT